MDFWLSSEDLPRPEVACSTAAGEVVFALEENGMDAHHRLGRKLEKLLNGTVADHVGKRPS
jgi:hypothetical protein